MRKFVIGADPELFLQDAAGAYIAACGRIGGSKSNPMPLPIGDGFAVQEDNVALEYNVPPSQDKEQFVNTINRAMSYLTDMVQQKGYKFASTSAVSFPMQELLHPAAMQFGCDPDFNAWLDGKANPRPAATDRQLRTCGGHVHVGHKFKSRKQAFNFVKYLDLFLGVPSTLLDEGDLRKNLYGKAGACRIKPYGVEYRSLSNFWVLDPVLTAWIWDATSAAMEAWHNKTINVDVLADDIQGVINNNDKAGAHLLIESLQLPMPQHA